ncbi:hypothetical protein PG993_012563 [Apiospora rasikravindrae]|uniref:Prion-inhibition and propagation HeLo domain-containing protein n=1 Tax=Apiospora rasikravindrae TaxID=990691 RepID=A0ABR1S2U1_9PEZI
MSDEVEADWAAFSIHSLFAAALNWFDCVCNSEDVDSETLDALVLKLDNAQLRPLRWGKSVRLSEGSCALKEEEEKVAKEALYFISKGFKDLRDCYFNNLKHKDMDEVRSAFREEFSAESDEDGNGDGNGVSEEDDNSDRDDENDKDNVSDNDNGSVKDDEKSEGEEKSDEDRESDEDKNEALKPFGSGWTRTTTKYLHNKTQELVNDRRPVASAANHIQGNSTIRPFDRSVLPSTTKAGSLRSSRMLTSKSIDSSTCGR